MKLYGSLNNRLEENKLYCNEIKVGTGVTEYSYTDRTPYEVTQVINQSHVFIREMEAKRIDGNRMSDVQEYEYTSNFDNNEIELVKRSNVWYEVNTYSKRIWDKAIEENPIFKNYEANYKYLEFTSGLTQKQLEKIKEGKEVVKYKKFGNISFGIMEKYFDYTF